jgi:hypothetical protein
MRRDAYQSQQGMIKNVRSKSEAIGMLRKIPRLVREDELEPTALRSRKE